MFQSEMKRKELLQEKENYTIQKVLVKKQKKKKLTNTSAVVQFSIKKMSRFLFFRELCLK